MSLLLSYQAVKYSLEVDADHRKNGLIPRAFFTEPSGSDQYKSSGIIVMKTKGKKECVTKKLVLQVFIFLALLWSKSVCGCDRFCVISFILQENIKDKLRALPIDVSVNIQDAQRKRRQSSTSQLSPVLDAKDQMTTREKVCLQNTSYNMSLYMCYFHCPYS